MKRMDELREEIGVQMSLMGRLVACWLRCAGHMVQMGEERMAKRVDRLKEQVRRKRGRQQLRWEDWLRRYIRKVGWLERGESWLRTVGSGGVLWPRQSKSVVSLELTLYKGQRRRRRRWKLVPQAGKKRGTNEWR